MTQTITGLGLGIGRFSTQLGAYGPKSTAALGQGAASAYVNAANGNLVVHQLDGFLAAAGFGLELFQTYNSRGEQGSSWCFNVNSRLECSGTINQEGSSLLRIAEDGHRSRFIWNAAQQQYRPEEGGTATIVWTAKGWMYHEGNSKSSSYYDASGFLTELSDAEGHRFLFKYQNGQLASITDSSGQQNSTWTFQQGLLRDLTTSSNGVLIHHLHYDYDAQQRLCKVARDLGHGSTYWITYDYAGDSNLMSDIRQSDGTALHIDYDAEGRVKQLIDGEGRISSYCYEKNRTVFVNGLGESWVYYYDERNRLTGIDGPCQYRIRYEYDGEELCGITQGTQRWLFRYNEAGDCIYSIEPNGQVTERVYDVHHQLVAQTQYQAFDGSHCPIKPKTTRSVYDARGHLAFAIDAQGTVTEYRYTAEGLLSSARCYLHASYPVNALSPECLLSVHELTLWTAQQQSQDISLIDYHYDWRGQLSEEIHYRAVNAAGEGILDDALRTRTLYDAAGRLIEKSTLQGSRWNSTYYSYDDLGRLLHSIDAQGNIQQWFYDDAHCSIIHTDANGLMTQSIYDRSALLLSTIQLNHLNNYGSTSYRYDAAGRLIATTNAEGFTSYFFYDSQGRLQAMLSAQGQMTTYRYNDEGLLLQTHQYAERIKPQSWLDTLPLLAQILPKRSAQDNIQQNIYNDYQQLVYSIDAQGGVIAYTYSAEGYILSKTAYAIPLAQYDAETLLTSQQVPLKTDGKDRRMLYYYDELGHVLVEVNGEGYATEYRYNHLGLLIETCQYVSPVLAYSGDWQRDKPDAKKADIHHYSLYDAQGLKVADIDGMGFLIEYRYNNDARMEARIAYDTAVNAAITIHDDTTLDLIRPVSSEHDQTDLYRYNELGQLREEQNHNGLITQYEYDAMGNLLLKSKMDANTRAVRQQRFRYDPLGRVVQQLDALGCAQLNQANLDTTEIEALWAQHSIHYSYDRTGLLVSTTDALQHTTRYFYNEYQQLNYTVHDDGSVIETQYNAHNQIELRYRYSSFLSGALSSLCTADLKARLSALKNETKDEFTTYDYDSLGRLIAQHTGSQGVIESQYTVFGELAWKTQSIDAARKTQTAYLYDRRGLLSQQTDDVGGLNRRTATRYDAFGWVKTQVDGKQQEISYSRNKRGEALILLNANNQFKRTGYDAFGRIIYETDYTHSKITTSYTYDDQHNTLSIKNAQLNTECVTHCNAFGDKVTFIDANKNKTEFHYDERGLLLRVDAADHSLTTYHYDENGQLSWSSDSADHKIAYTYDAQGHVLSKIIDPEGLNLCTRYQYDAIGRTLQVIEGTGLVKQFIYDNQGRVIESCIDPQGLNLRTLLSYDERGLLLRQTECNPKGLDQVTAYEWDNLSRCAATVVDPDGLKLVTRYQYDDTDQLIQQIDANQHSTRYVYDANHQCRYQIDARGVVTEHVYSINGKETQTIKYAQRIGALSEYTEQSVQAVLLKDSAHDQYQFFCFDAAGRVRRSYDSLGYATLYEYDANDNLIKKTRCAEAVSVAALIRGDEPLPSENGARATYFVYDRMNQLRFQYDTSGHVTESHYDSNGQLVLQAQYAQLIVCDNALNTVEAVQAVLKSSQGDKITRYAYDKAGRLAFDISPQGAVRSYQYNALNQITRCTRYEHWATPALLSSMNLADLQTSVADRSNTFVYDAAGREVYRISAEGRVVARQYDNVGNVVSQISYQQRVHNGVFLLEELRALLAQDQGARDSTYEYDAAGRLIRERNAMQQEVQYSYDNNGNVNHKTAANKAQWSYRYDEANQLIETTTPITHISTANGVQQRAVRTRIDYDSFGNLVQELHDVDGIQQKRCYEYDAMNRRIKTIYPGVKVNNAAYRASNQRQEVVQDLSEVQRFNAFGELVASCDKAGYWQYFAYDAQGHLIYTLGTNGAVTQHQYDAFGRLQEKIQYYTAVLLAKKEQYSINEISAARQKDERDRSEHYVYNLDDKLIESTRDVVRAYTTTAAQCTLLRPITRMHYNAFGEVMQTQKSIGQQAQSNELDWANTTNYYDKDGYQTAVVDAEGYLSTYTLNAFGERQSISEYATRAPYWNSDTYSIPPQNIKDRTQVFTYDALGQMTSKTLKQVAVSVIEQQQLKTYNKDLTSTYTYDALGHVTSTTDAQGNRSYCYYDEQGHLIAQVGPQLRKGRAATTYSYDALGNLVETRLWAHGASVAEADHYELNAASSADVITSSEFDEQGLLVSHTDGMQHKIEYSYDANGHVARSFQTLTQADGSTLIQDKRFEYDSEGHLIRSISFKNDGSTRTEDARYNLFGELTDRGINNQYSIHIDYDHLGRVWRSNLDGYYQIYLYDLADNLTQSVMSTNGFHPSHGEMGVDLSQWQTEYITDLDNDRWRTLVQRRNHRYDALGHLLEQSREYNAVDAQRSGDQAYVACVKQSQTVDRWGNCVLSTNALGHQTSYEYNALNAVTQQVLPEVSVMDEHGTRYRLKPVNHYYYDELGQEIAVIDANGNRTSKHYDAEGHCVAETDAQQNTRTKQYNLLHQLESCINELQGTTTYYYDKNNQLIRIATPNSDKEYSYDEAGQLIAQVLGRGADKERSVFEYDTLGNQISSQDARGRKTRYAYDDAGHKILEQDEFHHEKSWEYNEQGQLIKHRDLRGRESSYEYNYNGLLLQERTQSVDLTPGRSIRYHYQGDGQLIQYADETQNENVAFTYDDEGQMRSKISSKAGTHSLDGWIRETDHYEYDELGRLAHVRRYNSDTDNAARDLLSIDYDYDEVGNIRHTKVSAAYKGTSTSDAYYLYDANHRMTTNKGQLLDGRIQQGTQLFYDVAGNIIEAQQYQQGTEQKYRYVYDQDNQLVATSLNQIQLQSKSYNSAGRVTEERGFDAQGHLAQISNMVYQGGDLMYQITSDPRDPQRSYKPSIISYEYDAVGNLSACVTEINGGYKVAQGYTLTHRYQYELWDNYQQKWDYLTAQRYGCQDTHGQNERLYDSNGLLQETIDAQGDQNGQSNSNYYLNSSLDGLRARKDKTGQTSYLHVAGKTIGDLKVSLSGTQELNVYAGFTPLGASDQKQTANHDVMFPESPQSNLGSYTIQAGDSLDSIARQVYGDSSLWYLIADANGMSERNALDGSNPSFHPGQRLTIPPAATGQHHKDNTRVWLSSNVLMGNTSATVHLPTATALTQKHHHSLFASIVTGIITVVTTVLTAGIIGALTGAASAASGSLFSLGCSILGGTASELGLGGILATGLSAGFLGSIAGQGAAKALGMQERFDVAGALISGLATAASAGLLHNLNSSTSMLNKIGQKLASLGDSNATFNAVSAAQLMEENTVNQGLNLVFNRQQHFDWEQLGISTISAGFFGGAKGSALSATLKNIDFNTGILNSELNALGLAGAQAAVSKVHFDALHVLEEHLGSAVGASLVDTAGQDTPFVLDDSLYLSDTLLDITHPEQSYDIIADAYAASHQEAAAQVTSTNNLLKNRMYTPGISELVNSLLYPDEQAVKQEMTSLKPRTEVVPKVKLDEHDIQQRFVVALYPAVYAAAKETGLSLELMLAQAAHETGWGEHVLPGTNNMYNIKVGDLKSKGYLLENALEHVNGKDIYERSSFRKYASIEDSVKDRNQLLMEKERYANLFKAGVKGNARMEAIELQKSGYATDPKYAKKLIDVAYGPTIKRTMAFARKYYGY